MLARNASGNCIVAEFNYFVIIEINAANDGMAHISGIASPVI